MDGAKVKLLVKCGSCSTAQPPIEISHEQLKAWVHGNKIQECMPNLTRSERELLISGTCDDCFQEMFG